MLLTSVDTFAIAVSTSSADNFVPPKAVSINAKLGLSVSTLPISLFISVNAASRSSALTSAPKSALLIVAKAGARISVLLTAAVMSSKAPSRSLADNFAPPKAVLINAKLGFSASTCPTSVLIFVNASVAESAEVVTESASLTSLSCAPVLNRSSLERAFVLKVSIDPGRPAKMPFVKVSNSPAPKLSSKVSAPALIANKDSVLNPLMVVSLESRAFCMIFEKSSEPKSLSSSSAPTSRPSGPSKAFLRNVAISVVDDCSA